MARPVRAIFVSAKQKNLVLLWKQNLTTITPTASNWPAR